MATRSSGLGRGLSALIPGDAAGPAAADSTLVELPVSRVVPNRHQPRAAFDEEALAALTASVRELGVLQPILVRPADDGTVRAHRRRAPLAGRQAGRASRRSPPSSATSTTRTSLEQALVENLHRDDLNPLEEAAAYQQLIEEFGLTHEQVAARVGKSRAAITNTLRLFQLPPVDPAAGRRRPALRRPRPGAARHARTAPSRRRLARRAVDRRSVGPRRRGGGAGPNRARSTAPTPPASRHRPPPASRRRSGPSRARAARARGAALRASRDPGHDQAAGRARARS